MLRTRKSNDYVELMVELWNVGELDYFESEDEVRRHFEELTEEMPQHEINRLVRRVESGYNVE